MLGFLKVWRTNRQKEKQIVQRAEEVERLVAELRAILDAQEFFIKQGRIVCQYQVNNYKHKNTMPFTLMGHGIPMAAKALNLDSKRWEKDQKNKTLEWAKTVAKESGIQFRAFGRTYKPFKPSSQ